MEVAVAAGAVTGAIKRLLGKLASLLERKYMLSRGVKRQITSLRREMSTMSAFLVRLAALEELDEQQKDWRDKVRELSYDIEDCIDIFTNELDSNEANRRGLRRRLKKLKARYKIAHRIEELRAQVVELSNNHKRYKLDECTGCPCPQGSRVLVDIDPRLQALDVSPDRLVGIHAQNEKLIELLRMDDDTQELEVVAISGFGGMGKTTLANQVYAKIKGQFDCRAFVSVPRNPNMAKILSDIYLGINGCELYRRDDERHIIDQLRNKLQYKRYLIVIDDIWTMEAWNVIKGSFFENNLGSRVITTTRFEDIAQACCSSFHGHVYRIKPLDVLESRRLFDRRVFHFGDACPEKLKKVRDEILNKCEGVPLVILSVASILASHEELDSNEIWEKVHKNLGFHLEGHRELGWIRHVLNIGYNDLCLDLRTSLLYFSIFPESSEIMKNDLVKRWLAEGFVTEKHGYGPHDITESYFSELINRNMIQIAKFDECGHVLSCRVHDVMLDFIKLKSTEENFVTVMNDPRRSTNGCLKVRRLSLAVKNSECNHLLEKMSLTEARSFYFRGPAECIPSVSMFQLLRVLHINVNGKGVDFDLSGICYLFQLKYLRIVGILGWRPKQLWKLQHLQTLEIVPGGYEEQFGLDVGELPLSLWHLILPYSAWLVGDMGRMRSLISLDRLAVDDIKGMERMRVLGNLTDLRELKLYVNESVWITYRRYLGPPYLKRVLLRQHLYVPYLDGVAICEPLLSSLGRLGSLQSLIISGGLPVDVLTCWSPPPCHLRRLHVSDCPFSSVPDWITQLANLRSLEIQVRSMTRDGIQILAELASLVNLRLSVTKHIPREGVIIPGGAAFPKLKDLFFQCKVLCLVFETGAMPRLEDLAIECYSESQKQCGWQLEGIEHLGSLNRCKVNICRPDDLLPTFNAADSPNEYFMGRPMRCGCVSPTSSADGPPTSYFTGRLTSYFPDRLTLCFAGRLPCFAGRPTSCASGPLPMCAAHPAPMCAQCPQMRPPMGNDAFPPPRIAADPPTSAASGPPTTCTAGPPTSYSAHPPMDNRAFPPPLYAADSLTSGASGPPTTCATSPPTSYSDRPPIDNGAFPLPLYDADPPTTCAAGPPTSYSARPPMENAAFPPPLCAADPPTSGASGPPPTCTASPPTMCAAGPPRPYAAGPPTSYFAGCPTMCAASPRPEARDRWDTQTLEDAVRRAINKHPGCLEVTVQSRTYAWPDQNGAADALFTSFTQRDDELMMSLADARPYPMIDAPDAGLSAPSRMIQMILKAAEIAAHSHGDVGAAAIDSP